MEPKHWYQDPQARAYVEGLIRQSVAYKTIAEGLREYGWDVPYNSFKRHVNEQGLGQGRGVATAVRRKAGAGAVPLDSYQDGKGTAAPVVEPAQKPKPTADTITREETAIRQAREAREEARELRQLASARAELLAALQYEYEREPVVTLPPPRATFGKIPAVVTLQLADVHGGQLMALDRGGGLGAYNLDVFCDRIDLLAAQTLRDLEMLRTQYDINQLILAAGGDLGDGACIYPNHPREAVGLAKQLRIIPRVLHERLLRPLAAAVPGIEFFGVPGNHGIVGGRKMPLDYVEDNLDIVIMDALRMRCEFTGITNVRWHPWDTWYAYWQLWGHTFFLSHGDTFKAWLGIPFYGAQRAHSRVQSMLGTQIDCMLSNHHHSAAHFGSGMSYMSMKGCSRPHLEYTTLGEH